MSKVAIVVLADTEGGEGLGRIVNALTAVKEFKESGDDVQLIFSGAGTKWVGQLANPEFDFHGLYLEVKDNVVGACGFCASAFEAADSVKDAGVCMLDDYGANMSYRKLINDGFHVLTF